ncbi:hypothetical protein NDU88_000867 [Pleurodeles waltl]|uniref:Uncharacterized protein n=1 Tax=Pleurodeles waltl TaxID=8319 RepID=A0AAV7WGQ4_PLEWA|nr:hypothetical protein NDU88_000867 [Pleurodeles waltl]
MAGPRTVRQTPAGELHMADLISPTGGLILDGLRPLHSTREEGGIGEVGWIAPRGAICRPTKMGRSMYLSKGEYVDSSWAGQEDLLGVTVFDYDEDSLEGEVREEGELEKEGPLMFYLVYCRKKRCRFARRRSQGGSRRSRMSESEVCKCSCRW